MVSPRVFLDLAQSQISRSRDSWIKRFILSFQVRVGQGDYPQELIKYWYEYTLCDELLSSTRLSSGSFESLVRSVPRYSTNQVSQKHRCASSRSSVLVWVSMGGLKRYHSKLTWSLIDVCWLCSIRRSLWPMPLEVRYNTRSIKVYSSGTKNMVPWDWSHGS